VTYFNAKNERQTSARIFIFDGAFMVCIESMISRFIDMLILKF